MDYLDNTDHIIKNAVYCGTCKQIVALAFKSKKVVIDNEYNPYVREEYWWECPNCGAYSLQLSRYGDGC